MPKAILLGSCLALGLAAQLSAGTPPADSTRAEKEKAMTARGTFTVKLVPLGPASPAEKEPLGRMSIDKQFVGDLEGTSKGEMLSAGTDVKGSAGYVAMEKVTGTLQGRSGNFVLQHSGTMNRGAAQLSVAVVPDSGTGELKGIAGSLKIVIAPDGTHSYEFDYTLPEGR
jgi:hypothetical protein